MALFFFINTLIASSAQAYEYEIRCENNNRDVYLWVYRDYGTRAWYGTLDYIDSEGEFKSESVYLTKQAYSRLYHLEFWGAGMTLDIDHWIDGSRPQRLRAYPSRLVHNRAGTFNVDCTIY